MADNGYSDGSVVVSTDLDTQGFEAGSDRLKNAIDSSTDKFQELGETLKNTMDQGVQAVQDGVPIIDKSLRDSVNAFQTNSKDIQSWVDKWADAVPEKKFESSISAINKMLSGLEGKFGEVSQAYASATDGGDKEISKFESKAATVEAKMDQLGSKIEEVYGTGIKTPNGEIFSAKDSDELKLIISKFDGLQKELARMQTEIVKVKTEAEAAKAAEVAAVEKARAETEAASESTRKLAEENKRAWQTVKQDVKSAESETKAFDSSYNSIGNSLKSLENKIFGLGPTAKKAMGGSESAVDSFEFKVANTQRQIQYLRERLEALGSTKVTSEEYNTLNSNLEAARAKLNELLTAKQKMLSNGTDKSSTEWKDTETAIVRATTQIQRYEQEKAQMEANGTSHIGGADMSGYQELEQIISTLETRIAELEAQVNKANGRTNILKTTLKGMGKIGVSAFQLVGKGIKTAVSKMMSFRKQSGGAVNGVKKLTKAFTSLGTRLKSLIKERFISVIASSVTEGIKNLSQVSPEVNAAMSSMMTALSQLKNSFAAAFAPILTAVTPILTTLINLLSDAFTKLGMFISALTGATSFKKAVTVQKDYAASLNDTSKAADKANKSVAGFDDLNNTSSSDSSSDNATNPADMFENVPIESKIVDFAKRLKDAFLGGDYEGLGSMIADKVNGIFQKINNAIRWDNVGPKITAFVDGLTRTFNALVDNINWTLIGDTIAKGINTLINTIYLLVTGIDWANLGKSLMNGLNGIIHGIDWGRLGTTIGSLFQSAISFLHSVVHNFDFMGLATGLGTSINNAFAAIDWAMLGDTLSTGVKNVYASIRQFIKTIDFNAIGSDVATALNNIDWPGIITELIGYISEVLTGALDLLIGFAQKLDWAKLGTDLWNCIVKVLTEIDWGGILAKVFELLGTAVGGIATLAISLIQSIWDALKEAWYALGDYFVEEVDAAGGNLWEGFANGIIKGLVNIGTWIKEHIFDPFINGFKSVFGIHSPSTVMEDMGGFLIQGLKNGISNIWTGIKTFFSDAWQGIKTTCTKAWDKIKTSCTEAWDKVTGKISDACGTIKSKVSEGFSNAVSTISSKVSSIKSKISEGFSNAVSTVSSKISNIKSKVSEGFSSMVSTVSGKVSDIAGAVSDKFSDMCSDAWTWGSDICSNISNGINSCADWVRDSVSSVASTIKDFLGFSEPDKGPLSNFHTYMPDMLQLMADGINKNKGIAIHAVSDLASAISDEAQDTSVLMPICAETQYTRFLNNFSNSITDAFTNLISRLEIIASNVSFTTPAVAAGTVTPYSVNYIAAHKNRDNTTLIDTESILSRIDTISRKLDDVVDAIENKETGITDEAVYTSVKRSARRETKSTGKNPFSV